MRQTLRPTSTKPYRDELKAEQMSPLATEADVNAAVAGGAITQGTVADSTATDVPGIVADHNTLLAALRTAGILTV